MQESLFNDIRPNDLRQPPLQQCSLSGSAMFNADCMDILPLIPDESVDIILTDPPYNIGYADQDKFFNIPEITKQWYRILKHNGSVFCFAGSGTLLEASKNKGNTFIGIEKEHKYYDLAITPVFRYN